MSNRKNLGHVSNPKWLCSISAKAYRNKHKKANEECFQNEIQKVIYFRTALLKELLIVFVEAASKHRPVMRTAGPSGFVGHVNRRPGYTLRVSSKSRRSVLRNSFF